MNHYWIVSLGITSGYCGNQFVSMVLHKPKLCDSIGLRHNECFYRPHMHWNGAKNQEKNLCKNYLWKNRFFEKKTRWHFVIKQNRNFVVPKIHLTFIIVYFLVLSWVFFINMVLISTFLGPNRHQKCFFHYCLPHSPFLWFSIMK